MNQIFFRGKASTWAEGGNIAALGKTLFRWGETQRVLIVQNETGGELRIALERELADSASTDADLFMLPNGRTLTLSLFEFGKLVIHNLGGANVVVSGAGKTCSVVAWANFGNYHP